MKIKTLGEWIIELKEINKSAPLPSLTKEHCDFANVRLVSAEEIKNKLENAINTEDYTEFFVKLAKIIADLEAEDE